MFQFRTIYTKTVRSIAAKIPNPINPNASEPIKLNDGSLFISLNDKVLSTVNCPIVPNRCGRILTEAEIVEAQRDAQKYKSVGKFCGKYNVSRSFAINQLNLEKDKFAEEERVRIEKLSVNRKRGLIMRRLIRKNRFETQ